MFLPCRIATRGLNQGECLVEQKAGISRRRVLFARIRKLPLALEKMKQPAILLVAILCVLRGNSAAADSLLNARYRLVVASGGAVTLHVDGMSPQVITPEFTVVHCEQDPRIFRNFNHPNYLLAPRPAVRWLAVNEPTDTLNAWLASPAMKSAIGYEATVTDTKEGRVWGYRDKRGKRVLHVSGRHKDGTTRPMAVAENRVLRATKASVDGDAVCWEFPANDDFAFSAKLRLPQGDADPEITFAITPKRDAFYSVAFTGAPSIAREQMLRVPQECGGRSGLGGDFVLSEADLKLPRVLVATREGCTALVADPRECRFRLPTLEDSRFGLMLAFDARDQVKPVLLAPLFGGVESQMQANSPWRFTMRIASRAGDWTAMHRHIAQDIHGLSNRRDNSGPGSMNATLEHVMDFLADRNSHNYAMWSDEQKYYDYFTDQTGVFKPFSPLYGLGAAIVTDDEDFFRRRARPAVEFALSRKYNLFSPYEGIYRAIVKSAASDLGAPYVGYAQLLSLHRLLQERSPVLRALAEAKGPQPKSIADGLARWRLTGDSTALEATVKAAGLVRMSNRGNTEQALSDLLELHDATHDTDALSAAVAVAYRKTTELNLYPAPPDEDMLVDAGGHAPVHKHSFGRHKNVWGFPTPQPVPTPEQTAPAWRISRLGLPSPAYPMEYWVNSHAALLHVSALSHDAFLRDVACNGMVGRFGNYPGDNRSIVSLIAERADAVEAPPWEWNFATVNPGHAWDFAGAVIDWLVTQSFVRSHGAVRFPAESAAGSSFRVRIYGAAAGEFYGDKAVRLWLPRGLVTSDNRQLDWLAAHGNGQLYLALINQSARDEHATIRLNRGLVECRDGEARCWCNNQVATAEVAGNRVEVTVPGKGIVALAIPAYVRLRLQAKLYAADAPALPAQSYADTAAPFGEVHAMLLTAGRGLTSAFIYTEAKPENVIAARLHWRQGDGAWCEQTDSIFPYEFSPELREDDGDFQCVFEVEDARQQLLPSQLITLPLASGRSAAVSESSPTTSSFIVPATAPLPAPPADFHVTDDFIAYLKTAANPQQLGLRNGRYYSYSTPQGRRIAWRLAVWDKALFSDGCTPADAESQLRAALAKAEAELKRLLSEHEPAVEAARLNQRQRETLLDFALSEGAANIPPALLAALLAGDWPRLAHDHLYIRYNGPAPDHARNKAFAARWNID